MTFWFQIGSVLASKFHPCFHCFLDIVLNSIFAVFERNVCPNCSQCLQFFIQISTTLRPGAFPKRARNDFASLTWFVIGFVSISVPISCTMYRLWYRHHCKINTEPSWPRIAKLTPRWVWNRPLVLRQGGNCSLLEHSWNASAAPDLAPFLASSETIYTCAYLYIYLYIYIYTYIKQNIHTYTYIFTMLPKWKMIPLLGFVFRCISTRDFYHLALSGKWAWRHGLRLPSPNPFLPSSQHPYTDAILDSEPTERHSIEILKSPSPRYCAAGGRRPPLQTPAPPLILLPHAPLRRAAEGRLDAVVIIPSSCNAFRLWTYRTWVLVPNCDSFRIRCLCSL